MSSKRHHNACRSCPNSITFPFLTELFTFQRTPEIASAFRPWLLSGPPTAEVNTVVTVFASIFGAPNVILATNTPKRLSFSRSRHRLPPATPTCLKESGELSGGVQIAGSHQPLSLTVSSAGIDLPFPTAGRTAYASHVGCQGWRTTFFSPATLTNS